MAINLPSPPVFPPTPSSEPYADISGFLGALITRIKNHKNYTDAIGKVPNARRGLQPRPKRLMFTVIQNNLR